MKQHGFTLVEILLVVAVLSLLTYLGLSALRNARQVQTLSMATRQVVNDLEKTRNNALKYSQDSTFTLTTSSMYTRPDSTNTVTGTLPAGVTVGFCQDVACTTTTPTGTVVYLSPNGEVPSGNYALKLQHQNLSRYIKIIGVTGKVVDSAEL